MKSGIYTIINQVNGKFYVGSAVNFRKRWLLHRSNLNNETHPNRHLQHAWNKYGEENFYFGIIEPVENKEDLLGREQYWMDLLKPEYNICTTAGSSLGYKHRDESRQKISEAQRGENNHMFGRTGEKHPMYGSHRSDETRRKMSGEKNPMFGRTGKKHPAYKHAKRWEYNGKSQPLSDWAREYGFDPRYIQTRVNTQGWSLERALLTPVTIDHKGEKNPRYKHAKRWEYNGKSQPLSDWIKEYGINKTTLNFRIKELGWSLERALLTPVKTRRK